MPLNTRTLMLKLLTNVVSLVDILTSAPTVTLILSFKSCDQSSSWRYVYDDRGTML